MNIIVTGTRGIPDIQGGVETHCEEIFPYTAKSAENKVTIIRRSGFVTQENNVSEFKNINIVTLYSPRSKSFEAFFHTFLSVMYAAWKRPDILHIHAVGPSLFVPLARLLGLKVVMTHHGPDYERKKWGKLAKSTLKLGERFGVLCANRVIVISHGIKKSIQQKYGRTDCILIPNGVPFVEKATNTDYLDELGLEKYKYIFTLGRFVEEKGFDYLIEAYKQTNIFNQYKLVIAGDADHETSYSRQLKEFAIENGIILTGFIKGDKLKQLFSFARLFVLPSFYEGLPISLLEAMRYELSILASDIEPNKEVELPSDCYFKIGCVDDLAVKLKEKLANPYLPQQYNMDKYNWEEIAAQTYMVYQSLLNK